MRSSASTGLQINWLPGSWCERAEILNLLFSMFDPMNFGIIFIHTKEWSQKYIFVKFCFFQKLIFEKYKDDYLSKD